MESRQDWIDWLSEDGERMLELLETVREDSPHLRLLAQNIEIVVNAIGEIQKRGFFSQIDDGSGKAQIGLNPAVQVLQEACEDVIEWAGDVGIDLPSIEVDDWPGSETED